MDNLIVKQKSVKRRKNGHKKRIESWSQELLRIAFDGLVGWACDNRSTKLIGSKILRFLIDSNRRTFEMVVVVEVHYVVLYWSLIPLLHICG